METGGSREDASSSGGQLRRCDGMLGVEDLREWMGDQWEALRGWLRPAPRTLPRPRPGFRRTASVALVIFLGTFGLGILINSLDPFGMKSAAERHSSQVAARFLAPRYDSQAQDHVAVLLIDSSTLDHYGMPWPAEYGFYEETIRRLLRLGAAGIYVDILLADEGRADPTLADAREWMQQELADHPDVPVVFGATAVGQKTIFGDVPGVASGIAMWHGLGEDYPLLIDPGNRFHDAGRETVTVAASSPAYLLYRGVCQSSALPGCHRAGAPLAEGSEREPMTLFWGQRLPRASAAGVDCTVPEEQPREGWFGAGLANVWASLKSGFRSQEYQANREACPYTLTLRLQELEDSAKQELIRDRVVMVGTMLPGMDDSVFSPVHQLLPGVYQHAMALDNLMHWGEQRLHRHPWTQFWISVLVALALSAALAFAHMHVAGAWARRGLLLAAFLAFPLGSIAAQQIWLRQPPIDWLGLSALFAVVFLGVRPRRRRKQDPEAAPVQASAPCDGEPVAIAVEEVEPMESGSTA